MQHKINLNSHIISQTITIRIIIINIQTMKTKWVVVVALVLNKANNKTPDILIHMRCKTIIKTLIMWTIEQVYQMLDQLLVTVP